MKRAIKTIKKVLRFGVLALFAMGIFFIFLEIFYPVNLQKSRDLSRVVKAEDGSWLFATLNSHDKWRFRVDSKRLDPLYLKMLLNFEDKRFYHHIGVDFLALVRASWQMVLYGHITSGASTITMQLARLLEPKERTLSSKIVEIFRAFQLELHYSKKKILESYLTLAPYGGNIEGIVAASMHYFGKLPTALTPAEAAMLVALPQSPQHNRPQRHPRWAKEARDKVLLRSLDANIITPTIYSRSRNEPLKKRSFRFPRLAPHLSLRLLREHNTTTITTTLNLPLQRALEQWVKVAAKSLPKDATVAVTVVRNSDGGVVGYLGSRNIFSRESSGYIDMLRAVRSPGSVLKPLIYGLGIERHIIDTNTIIADEPLQVANYRPHNFTHRFYGEVTIAKALQNSLNIPAVKVLQAVGARAFIERLQEAVGAVAVPKGQVTLPVALGGLGITPLQVAQLYTLLANGGSGYRLRLLKKQPLLKKRVLSPKAAIKITNMLREMHPPNGYDNNFYKVAYKTGTSYGYRDFWSAAYSKGYTVVVWVGKASNAPLFKASAREIAAPFAFAIMQITQSLLPHESWSFAPGVTTTLPPSPLLHYFDKKSKKSRRDFDILYPKEGTKFQSASCQSVSIEIALQGGVKPYTWYIDGKPTPIATTTPKLKLSAGAHTIAIIDNTGKQIIRNIWVNAPECRE